MFCGIFGVVVGVSSGVRFSERGAVSGEGSVVIEGRLLHRTNEISDLQITLGA